jgi:hypothetical protein
MGVVLKIKVPGRQAHSIGLKEISVNHDMSFFHIGTSLRFKRRTERQAAFEMHVLKETDDSASNMEV